MVQSGVLVGIKLQRADPDAFAAFQVKVSCAATLLVMALWVAFAALRHVATPQAFGRIDAYFRQVATTMASLDATHGDDFPLYQGSNMTALLEVQASIEPLYLELPGVLATAAPVSALQLVGLGIVVLLPRHRWRHLKHVLHLHICWLAYASFLVFELTYTVNLIPNALGLMLTMPMPPFFFAVAFCMQSDIYPTASPSRARMVADGVARVVLVVSFFCSVVGVGMYVVAQRSGEVGDAQEAYALRLLATSSSIVAVVLAMVVCIVGRGVVTRLSRLACLTSCQLDCCSVRVDI